MVFNSLEQFLNNEMIVELNGLNFPFTAQRFVTTSKKVYGVQKAVKGVYNFV